MKKIFLILILGLFLIGIVAAETRYEYDNDGTVPGAHTSMSAAQRFSQAFTIGITGANENFVPQKISLQLFRTSAGIMNVSIRRVQGGGNETPISSDFCSGTYDTSSLTTDQNGEWINVSLSGCPTLNASTQYTIFLSPGTSNTGIKVENPAGYIGGNISYSANVGLVWSTLTYNAMFEVWGQGIATGDSIIILNSPENNSAITDTGSNFTINYNLSISGYEFINSTYNIWNDDSSLFNKTTISVTGENNASSLFIDNFVLGDYIWNTYACWGNATYSNCSWANNGNFSFIVGANLLSANYSASTYETARETFSFTINALEGSEISFAQLVYNGENYTISEVIADGENYILTTEIDIPLNSNPFANQTNSFFLRFTYAGSFVQDFNIYYQNSSFINLQLCNATYLTRALNFTLMDEQTGLKINPSNSTTTFQSTFNYWIGGGSVFKNYSYQAINSSTIANYSFCIASWPITNKTFKTTMTSTYSAIDYSEREYNLYNSTLTNVSSDIILYLIDSSNYQKFTITVKEGVSNLKNAIITVSKYFLGDGTYKTVSIRKTDNVGQFVEYLELDRDYRYFVTVNGEFRAAIDKRASCNLAPCEFTLQIDGDQGDVFAGYYEQFANDTISSMSFDQDTKIVTYTFLDITGLAHYFRLVVEQINLNATQNIICDTYSYSSSGTLTCNVTGYSGDFIARGYISRSPEKLDQIISFVIGDLLSVLGKLAIVASFIIILTFTIAGGVVSGGNPTGFLIGFGISVLGTKLMTIFPFSWIIVSVLELLVIFLIMEVNKR